MFPLVCAVHATEKEIYHGKELTLDIPDRTEAVKFIPANEKVYKIIWKRNGKVLKGKKYSVTSHVTFRDAGTYTLLNAWNNEISSYTVKVHGK